MQTRWTENEQDLLTFDIQDEVLERAGGVGEAVAATFGNCTYFYECGWPLDRK